MKISPSKITHYMVSHVIHYFDSHVLDRVHSMNSCLLIVAVATVQPNSNLKLTLDYSQMTAGFIQVTHESPIHIASVVSQI